MESSEAVPTGKSCNQETPGLLVGQTTEELESWKLNEQQQQLVDASGLGNLIHTASLAIDRAVIRAFCQFWSKETNTDGSMTSKWHHHSGTLPTYWGFR